MISSDLRPPARPALVYLDHAATSPLRPGVLEAMLPWLEGGYGNASSVHRLGRQARVAAESARERIAAVLGCEGAEVVFTSGGTEADNLALRGVLTASSCRKRGARPGERASSPVRPSTKPFSRRRPRSNAPAMR